MLQETALLRSANDGSSRTSETQHVYRAHSVEQPAASLPLEALNPRGCHKPISFQGSTIPF